MTKGKKQMDGTERGRIEFQLSLGCSERSISKDLGRSLTTVSREIKKHTYVSFKGCYGSWNQCIHRADCKRTNVCANCPGKGAPCARCTFKKCNLVCPHVEFVECAKRLTRPGQVCNGCPDEKKCRLRKFFYVAQHAQEDCDKLRSDSRQGAALEPHELKQIDDMFSDAIKAGQSVHHICVTHAAELIRNERTIQRYVNYGVLSAKRGDLKRACTVRPRKSLAKAYQHKVESGCYVGRSYRDYEAYLAAHPGVSPVYMDLVIGRPGGVCLLTLHWLDSAFMVGILIPNKCAASVTAVFDRLYAELGHELFSRLFQVILTDRGTEFSNPTRIEETEDGTKRTKVFFCDPMNSNQKSQIERNHEIVREILPKGVSFDGLTQEKAYLALSHVNAYVRLSQSDRTPYDVFEFLHGKGMAEKLHIAKIDPKEVVLKPRLVGIEMK